MKEWNFNKGIYWLLVLVLLTNSLLAKPAKKTGVYFVNALTGNDANNGQSPRKAWKSMQRVNTHFFNPGDKLLFQAGQAFEGQLKPQGRGSKAAPVTIDRIGKGDNPHLKAAGNFRATLHLYNTEYWVVQNLTISNNGPFRKARRTGVLVTIDNFGVAHGITLKNLQIKQVNGSLVKKEGGGAGIEISNGGRQTKSWFEGLLIEGCHLLEIERNGILVNGYWRRTDWYPNLGVVIRKNVLEKIPGDGIVPTGCDGALIEHNIMRNGTRLLPDGEAAAGIWPWSSDNTLIQYNEVSDHKALWDAQGFDADWNCRNTLIQYNYSHDNEGGFLLVCNDGSASLKESVGNTGTVVRFNISINDGYRTSGKHAGFSPAIHIAGPVFNTCIYNNLIVSGNRNAQTDSSLIAFDSWGGFSDSCLIANNIFHSLTMVDYCLSKSTRTHFTHNLYSGMQQMVPADTAAILLNPQFVNASIPIHLNGREQTRGFVLKETSPAKHKGLKLPGFPNKDYFGNNFNSISSIDIGPHQSGKYLPANNLIKSGYFNANTGTFTVSVFQPSRFKK